MKSIDQLLFFIVMFCVQSVVSAQTKPKESHAYYIPYNDHGVWGWCDTSGNVMIHPEYKETSFFVDGPYKTSPLQAKISTQSGKNIYIFKKGLLVPQEYELVGLHSHQRWCIIKNEQGKIGLFDSEDEIIKVIPDWDTIYQFEAWEPLFFVGKTGIPELTCYDVFEDSLYQTDIISFSKRDVYDPNAFESRSIDVFIHSDGSLTRLYDGKQMKFIEEKKKEVKSSEIKNSNQGQYFYAAPDDGWIPDVPSTLTINDTTPSIDSINGIVLYVKNGRKVSNCYEPGTFTVIKKNNKLGVITSEGNLFLPYEYDRLVFREVEHDVLIYKNDKVGLKSIWQRGASIHANYHSIKGIRSFHLPDNSLFTIYEVTIDSNKGYVGENGIEYFKF